MPTLAPDDVRAAIAALGRPRFDRRHRLAEDPVLDGLPVTVEALELVCKKVGLAGIVGEDEVEGHVGPAEAAGGVDPGREPEGDGSRVDRRGVHACDAHQRRQTRLLRPCEPAQAGRRERAVLVEEGDDVGDRRERDEVRVAREERVLGTEQRLRQLGHDAGAAEIGKGVVGRARGHDRALRQALARPMVVGDDHVDAQAPGPLDLGDGRDTAVDGEDERDAVLRETGDRRAGEPVALLEAARQVPADVRSELAQRQRRKGRGADAVDVVVAVYADPLALLDCRAKPFDGHRHVAEEERVVRDSLRLEERASRLGIGKAAPDEDARDRLRDAELVTQRADVGERHRIDLPACSHHFTIGPAPDGSPRPASAGRPGLRRPSCPLAAPRATAG